MTRPLMTWAAFWAAFRPVTVRNEAKTYKAAFGLTKPNPGAQERRVTQSAGPYKQGVAGSSPAPPIPAHLPTR
jgi:hypothetical protein